MEATTVPQMVDLVLWNSIDNRILADHIRNYGVVLRAQVGWWANDIYPSLPLHATRAAGAMTCVSSWPHR